MTRTDLEKEVTSLQQQENQHRVLAERAAGARQAFEHLLKNLPADEPVKGPAPVSEFPRAVEAAEMEPAAV